MNGNSANEMNGKENPAFELNEKPSDEKNQNGGTISTPTTQIGSMSKARIYKNLFVICIAFLCLFLAFQALGNLQSTLNIDGGLGTAAQSTLYASLIISSFFLPTFIIRKLGCKLTLGICMLMYTPYIAANFDAKWWNMIPAAIILGIGASPMWSAKCTYLNEIGFRFSKHVNSQMDTIIIRFFGIFFMFFQSSQIWGNLLSYLILTPENEEELQINYTCGFHFDHREKHNVSGLVAPDADKVNTLIGVFLGTGILGGVLVLIFLDPLEREFSSQESQDTPVTHLLVATFKHMRRKEQYILIPLTVYSGLEQAFFLSEFTRSYVACAWGIPKIGLVAISFGVVNAFFSLMSGPIVKYVKRLPVFATAAAANIGACVAMIVWTPDKDQAWVFFVIAGLWGLGDAIWQTQINAFYGVLFQGDEEPAFSNYRLWESLGFVAAFGYADALGVPGKMGILLGFLGLGMIGYIYTELRLVGKRGQNTVKT